MNETRTRVLIASLLALAYCLFLLESGQAQNLFPSTTAETPLGATPSPPCALPPASLKSEPHVYHIPVTSPEEHDQIEYRKELWNLISQTFADDEQRIYDRRKYDRILRLAKKLKNVAHKDIPSQPTRYRPR